ncbi:MAG: LysM peptidoglycan-binding domain-containing protein [Pseudomonadota bacterium]|nr:LysM peptidoglycan-binding domain-containing protein [Pseudomonadota bacterium]
MRATQVMFRQVAVIGLIVAAWWQAGCAVTPRPVPGLSAAPPLPEAVPPSTIDPMPALAQARSRLREARHRQADVGAAQALLTRAEAAVAGGQVLRALRLARRADVLAEVAINDRFAELARVEQVAVRQRTRLTEAQATELRMAEQAMAAREFRRAYDLLAHLNQSARLAELAYRVVRGDSLWRIAARPEIYDNGFLWPLIYQANRARLRHPSDLAVGAELEIPQHPTVEAIYEALVVSGGLGRGQVAIGRVRPATDAPD